MTFRQRITLALAALATITALQGGFAIWAVGLAEHHVLRGRVAADISQGFADLWLDKQRLRNWLAQRQFGAGAADEQRDAMLSNMRATLDRLDRLAEQAVQLDEGVTARLRQAQRRDNLMVLRASLEQLARGLASLNQPTPGLDTSTAWRIANELFDNAEGRDLRLLLAEIREREDVALREKRADTNDSLAWLRLLWIATTTVLVLSALLLAVSFMRALHTPLLALSQGATALREGLLDHRIHLDRADEFGAVARSMNAMAEQLSAHRDRERLARQGLEDQVAQRTAELTMAIEAQREAEIRRRRLFADISHELRTPTTAIRGEAQIALRGPEKSVQEYRQTLQRIEDASRQLGTTIDDLLTMARSDIDSLSLAKVDLDIADVLSEAARLGTAMANARGVRFASQAWPAGLAMRGDPDRLRQMLLVLIDNAVRYSHSGGTVELAARRFEGDPEVLELTIRDEGIGIEETELLKVFERGYRAHNGRSHCADGSGLGLPIAAVLARGHGGDIVLKRNANGGTDAVVTLPLSPFEEGNVP